MPVPNLPKAPMADASEDIAAQMRSAMTSHAFPQGAAAPATFVVEPNAPFFLRHHPGNWQISSALEVPMVLPEISPFVLSPGAHGVRTRSKDDTDPTAGYRNALRNEMDRNWTFLDPAAPIPAVALPPGIPEGGYVRAVDCVHPITERPGTFYVEPWMLPDRSPDGKTEFTFHRASYERWLLWLVESGQIEPPTAADRRRLLSTAERHLETRLQTPYQNPEIAKKYQDAARARRDAAAAAKLPEQGSQKPSAKRSAARAEGAA